MSGAIDTIIIIHYYIIIQGTRQQLGNSSIGFLLLIKLGAFTDNQAFKISDLQFHLTGHNP